MTPHELAAEIVMHRKLCEHEAGHAAAALVQGLEVEWVEAPRHSAHAWEHGTGQAGFARVAYHRNDPAEVKAFAISCLAGPMENRKARLRFTLAPTDGDEEMLLKACELLGIEDDETFQQEIVGPAIKLFATPQYNKLYRWIFDQLEEHHCLDAARLRYLKSASQGQSMQHLTLKAAITDTEQGTFTAVISSDSVDREGDIVEPDGLVEALRAWTATHKQVPLAWSHSTKPEDIIGTIDPATAQNQDGEVVVDGQIDRTTERGAQAWRLAKSGSLGFSIGFMILKATERPGGGRHIQALDLFEVSATPTPMVASTRVVSWKSATAHADRDYSDDAANPDQELRGVVGA
jgi:HK97 family phage prohead protease